MKLKISFCIFSLIFCLSTFAQDWKVYPYTPNGSLISFSTDEGRHTAEPIEWWYTSGHITGATSGKDYSYMLTYFYYPASIFDGFRILNITDHSTGEFYQDVKPVNYTNLSTSNLDIAANVYTEGTDTWTNKLDGSNAIIPFEYVISAAASVGSLNLEYETLKRPLILGDDGYLDQGLNNYTYYYSQTKNAVTGTLTLNGTTESVTGTSWIDRQYGDFNPLTGEKYEWFCLQLSNGMDINLWNVFTNTRTVPDNDKYKILAAYVDESTQYTTSDFQIERLAFNWMQDDVMCYSKQWRLTSALHNIDLTITVEHDNTEVQLPFRFFEGSTTITGTIDGVAVTGLGFAELLHSYENPEVSFVSPNGGIYDTAMPISWQLNNPDDGRPIYYDLEYSIDNQVTFLPITQDITTNSYTWNNPPLSNGDEVWFKLTAHSVDGVLADEIITASSSTATLDISDANVFNVKLFPNPVEQQLTLQFPYQLSDAYGKIIDIQGRLVKAFKINSDTFAIDTKFLKSGLYYLKLDSNGKHSAIKFIKK